MISIIKLFLAWTVLAFTTALAANPWQARHRMTSDVYQSTFNDLVGQGYRLNYKSSPEWQARHGMTSDNYQATFNDLTSKGFRLVLVNGYTVSGQDRYVAIWDKSVGGAWVARHRMTSSEYQSAFNTYTSQGYRLKHVSGYAIGTEARYAAIWEKTSDTSAWVARHGLTSAQYQQEFNNLTGQGYRLSDVSGYGVNGVDYYAAIFEKKAGPAFIARHGLNSAQYQSEFDTDVNAGYMLKVVSGYTLGNDDRYAALFEK
ncbi:hypothetical protein CPB86DRAFT_790514 [Serendipita vermifera]|nr:hypothetical protein CPB86DRAFT_790514 [Serendipita vermifera]